MATNKKANNLNTAIIYILVGVIFCIFKASLLNWLMTAVGVLFIVQGVLKFMKNDVKSGVIDAVIGVLVILGGWLFLSIVLLVFGVLVLVSGVLELLGELKKSKSTNLIAPVLKILLGAFLLFGNFFQALDWVFIAIGVLFIIDGALYFIKK